MDYQEIYYRNEKQYHSINQQHFQKFLNVFKKETGIDTSHLATKRGIPTNDYRKQFYYLKYMVFINYPKYIKEFYRILENSKFDMSSEIVDAMKLIGKNTIYTFDEDIRRYILLSPLIDDVVNDNGNISIYSDELGDYNFCSTRKYLYKNKRALYLIQNYLTQGYCHQMSWELMSFLEQANLITTLLPAYFEGTYYHTVVQNQDNFIIDIANEIVIDSNVRDSLFKGQIISSTKKQDLFSKLKEAKIKEAKIKEAKNYENEDSFTNSLLLALYSESKKL